VKVSPRAFFDVAALRCQFLQGATLGRMIRTWTIRLTTDPCRSSSLLRIGFSQL